MTLPFPAEALDAGAWGRLAEPVVAAVAHARAADRVPHALLLVGPPGLGRELAAVEAAAVLTCSADGAAGCTCRSCARVRTGAHPDVTVVTPLEGKKAIAIEQVREVVEAAAGRPYEAPARVWIVTAAEVGQLGAEAANAFLKTLEEPPPHARFLLLAGNPDAVLPTIRSRCSQLVLPGVVAVASGRPLEGVPPELHTSAAAAPGIAGAMALTRSALEAAEGGDPGPLLAAGSALSEHDVAFQIAAATALEVAAAREDGEGLARLAADLLATERRTRALNLNRQRQLVAALLRWYRGAAEGP